METNFPKQLALAIGWPALKPFGIKQDDFPEWRKTHTPVYLGKHKPKQLEALLKLVKSKPTVRGSLVLAKDIETWLKAITSGTFERARTVQQFCALTTEMIRAAPGHRVFAKDDDIWLCYYVNRVRYHPPEKGNYSTTPEYVSVECVFDQMGGRKEESFRFYAADCRGQTPEAALGKAGLFLETPEMRERYLWEMEKFNAVFNQIGHQMHARGRGTDNLDGNKKKDRSGWWYDRTNTILLERDGAPSRVVIDVFREDDKEDRDRNVHLDYWFWTRPPETDEDDEEDAEIEPRPEVEVPVHPFLACFDLKRHTRLRIHIAYLSTYIYDTCMAEKLVLPPDIKSFVRMLLADKGEFKDIVKGKSGGAIVLCAGKPGTGKTLTAEVYAESTGRPLYSVQASQLGTDPDDLEDELLKVFARAQRWNAILLVDEADVYVRNRGEDLQQNAIVGVLLRVLEYYNGVLFLTTNRLDMVDDAIASRCMAHIGYDVPDSEGQAEIWRVLSRANGITLTEATITKATAAWPQLSGRDVKQLLKLAGLVSRATGKKVNFKAIEYVKRFKPTKDLKDA